MSRAKKPAKYEQPDNPDAVEQRYTGPWHMLTADALHSVNYKGRIDLGTYTEKEVKKGKLSDRVIELERQGYQNISVREIPKEEPEEEIQQERSKSKIGRKVT